MDDLVELFHLFSLNYWQKTYQWPIRKKKSRTLFIQSLSVSLGGDSALLMYPEREWIKKMKKHLQSFRIAGLNGLAVGKRQSSFFL